MQKHWKVIFAFSGIFIAGGITGAAICSLYYSRPLPVPLPVATNPKPATSPTQPPPTIEQFSHYHMASLAKRLELSSEQTDQLKPIIAQAGEDLRIVRRNNFLATAEILEHINTDVVRILTPEQKQRFEKIRQNQRDKLRSIMGAYGVKPRDLPFLRKQGQTGGETPKAPVATPPPAPNAAPAAAKAGEAPKTPAPLAPAPAQASPSKPAAPAQETTKPATPVAAPSPAATPATTSGTASPLILQPEKAETAAPASSSVASPATGGNPASAAKAAEESKAVSPAPTPAK